MKEYNFDDINEFFEDLIKCPNAKVHMLTVDEARLAWNTRAQVPNAEEMEILHGKENP